MDMIGLALKVNNIVYVESNCCIPSSVSLFSDIFCSGTGKLPGQKGIYEAFPLTVSVGGAGALLRDIEFVAVAPADCRGTS